VVFPYMIQHCYIGVNVEVKVAAMTKCFTA
jgi:hypothetical protein